MADNIPVTPGSGRIVAADEIAGVLHQRIKLGLGADGTAVDAVGGAGAVSSAVQRTTLASDDPAVTALAAILAKIIAAPATEANQDTIIAALATIVTHIDGLEGALATLNSTDFATQTTLADILAKIIAAPATEAKQDTLISAVGDLPTNTDPAMTALARMGDGDYETVAASQTTQTLGATGALGDYLLGLLIVPATTSPGVVQIKDGSNTAITVFTGGSDSVSNLVPFLVPLGIRSGVGAWQVTTGADVSAVAMGSFT